MGKKRWLQLCHPREVWCCFIFKCGPSVYVIPKWVSRELKGPQDYSLLSNVETFNRPRQAGQHLSPPKGKPLGSHLLGRKYLVHLDTPSMIEWTIVVGCIKNPVHRKVTHLSTILALGSLTLELPWDPALSHPLLVECTPIMFTRGALPWRQ